MSAGSSAHPPPARNAGGWIGAAAIVVAGSLAYANSFSGPFLFDDRAQVVDNPTVRHLGDIAAILHPPADAGVGGRPLLNLSFALNYAISGANVWSYHALNLAIHLCAALVLFGILRRVCPQNPPVCRFQVSAFDGAQARGLSLRRGSGQGSQPSISASIFPLPAFLISLLWTIHPLQTEAVTYVAERAESLMGLFYLLTLYCFIRYTEAPAGLLKNATLETWEASKSNQRDESVPFHPKTSEPSFPASSFPLPASRSPLPAAGNSGFRFQPSTRLRPGVSAFFISPPWPVLSVLACLLGAATKEVIVTAPIIVLLYDRTFLSGSFREAFRRRGGLYAGYLASWLLVGLLLGDVGKRGVGFGLGGSWLDYALGEGRVVLGYLGLAFWPHPLIFDRGMGVARAGAGALPSVVAVIVLVGATAWALFSVRGARPCVRWVGFAGAWFFLILAPTSSVVSVAGQPMAEHRMYLPLAAVIALVVMGGLALADRLSAGLRRSAVALFLAALVCACLALTVARNDVYRSEVSVWEDSLAGAPGNARAENALGVALAGEGRRVEAIAHYRRAIALEPRLPEAHQNLGSALLAAGDARGAVAECAEALRLRPSSGDYHRNLAVALRTEGSLADAEAQFREALKLQAGDAQAWEGLGTTLMAEGAVEGAIAPLRNAVRLGPDNLDARYNLANALQAAGDSAGAVDQFRDLLRAAPTDVGVMDNLAIALTGMGRLGEAESLLRQAIALAPARANLHYNLASLLVRLGRPDEAGAEFERVLSLDPGNDRAREQLAHLRGEGPR